MPPAPRVRSPAAVVLAAGRGRRMGRSKPLLPWGSTTLLDAWIGRFEAVGVRPVAVVTGEDGVALRAAVSPQRAVRWVQNDDVDGSGPRESLVLGLDALPADQPAFFTPVDVPVPGEAVFRALLTAYADADAPPFAVLPTWQGRDAHPVLAGPALIHRLFEGSRGDRIDAVFAWATRRLVRVPVDDPRVVGNMNSPADYLRFAAATND